MPEERRNQQSLDFNPSTRPALRGGPAEQKRRPGKKFLSQLNWWLKIGLTAQKKDLVFNNLFHHFNVENLREAFNALDGKKALGIDGISKIEYGKNLEKNLMGLTARLQTGSYKPQEKREVLIPKDNGKTRPIAISCFEDKLVEWVLGKILENIYEPLFIRNSFGFRPKLSAHHAIEATFLTLKDNKRPFVVEIDLATFFNTIPHGKLLEIVGKRVSDNRLKGLIGRFLKVGILEQSGLITTPESGTPQGSVMSPILANIYLNEVLDQWFLENYASYNNIIVRYADDAVFMFKSESMANQFLVDLEQRLAAYGLSLNKDKTSIIDFNKNENNIFHFLGFTFYWGKQKSKRKRPLRIKTQKEKLHKKIQEFDSWIKEERSHFRLKKIWDLAKAKLNGHYNYYGFWLNRAKLNHFYVEATRSLFKWLNRRSQKRSFDWEGFERKLKFDPLPLPPAVDKLRQLGWNPYV